ncbi:transcription termination factor 4, mitochondrial isoform X2 [Ursus arctos]|uniref:transcription termination factor 4, mitochondrial isoform X2 n=1 Tax=Ursus arctos TaxID=9644 RepID=UPI0025483BBF|nr:transcription termination factor 4, mitochondrial isoform X2 [Ursus arctos]
MTDSRRGGGAPTGFLLSIILRCRQLSALRRKFERKTTNTSTLSWTRCLCHASSSGAGPVAGTRAVSDSGARGRGRGREGAPLPALVSGRPKPPAAVLRGCVRRGCACEAPAESPGRRNSKAAPAPATAPGKGRGGTRLPRARACRGEGGSVGRRGRKRLSGEGWRGGPLRVRFRRRAFCRRFRAMAACGRQVFGWHRLVPLTWSHVARQTHHGEQKRTSASLLCKLTTASNGGGLENLSHVESRKYVREPECRTSLIPCPLEKQRTAVAPGFIEREKVVCSLLDMGFSDIHINELLCLWPSMHPQQLLDIISELILLGLNPEPVYVALKKSPQLLKLPVTHVRRRSGYLRKLGLGEGKLKTVLLCCPEIFTMHQRDIESIVGVLKEKCLFTVQQVTKILHRCPFVLREDPGELEYKFQKPRRRFRCLTTKASAYEKVL